MNKRTCGKFYEDIAVDFLIGKGYTILQRNFNCSFGEVDIIAEKKGVICFVEVKARTRRDFGSPLEAITPAKQKRMIKTAEYYCMKNKIVNKPIRFEAVGIELKEGKPYFDHVENILF